MKTVLQALFCSLFIHLVYFFSIYGWSYMKMTFEKVKLGGRYVAESHTEVAFLFIGSPVVILGTSFLGIAFVSGGIILLAKKFLKKRGIKLLN